MTKKQWMILGIAIVAIILIFGAVKLFPFWYTITAVISYVTGLISYYFINRLDRKIVLY